MAEAAVRRLLPKDEHVSVLRSHCRCASLAAQSNDFNLFNLNRYRCLSQIVMAWIGGVVGIVGLSKLTSKTPPTQSVPGVHRHSAFSRMILVSVPVASGSNGMEDLFKQYPELQSALVSMLR